MLIAKCPYLDIVHGRDTQSCPLLNLYNIRLGCIVMILLYLWRSKLAKCHLFYTTRIWNILPLKSRNFPQYHICYIEKYNNQYLKSLKCPENKLKFPQKYLKHSIIVLPCISKNCYPKRLPNMDHKLNIWKTMYV